MPSSEFVVECLWPGVHRSDLAALDERAESSAARPDSGVRYLGSLLMPEDEVVLCLFSGEQDAVRRAVEHAQIPFDRILKSSRSAWSAER